MYKSQKPIKRSKLRLFFGRSYYRFKRYLKWYFGKKKFALKTSETLLPYSIFTHKTPLMRQLKDVDMWLQHNKVKNLKLATQKIDKTIIKPGETFSYWRSIGKTSKRKGYVKGMVLSNGKVTTGIGGGLCQLSNLIFWMSLHTPMKVVERYRHGFDAFPDSNRTQPFGSGATCAYNYLDLQIKNTTKQQFQLHVYLTKTHLVGEFRSNKPTLTTYKVYEKEHKITHEVWGGYMRHNQINRKVFNLSGEQIKDEYITENHALMMYEPMLSGKENN